MNWRKVISLLLFLLVIVGDNVIMAECETDCGDKISVCGETCYAVEKDGTLWRWGTIEAEQAENGLTDTKNPQKILDDVKSVCGTNAIKTDGSLWVWYKEYIETDASSGYIQLQPPVMVMDNVKSVAIGDYARLILKNDNSLWVDGTNAGFKLGFSEDMQKISPAVKIANNVKKAASGEYHTIILKTDGTVWTMGENNVGQLGTSAESDYRRHMVLENVIDISAGVNSSYAIDVNHTLWRWGWNSVSMSECFTEPVKYLENIKQVVPMVGFDVILKTDNSLWIYGSSEKEEICYLDGPYSRAIEVTMPKKIADNVSSLNTGYSGYGQRVVFQNITGELYQLDFVETELYKGDIQLTQIDLDVASIAVNNEEEINEYKDISDKDIQSAVTALTKAKIVNGVTDTEFMPDNSITRAETATLLLRMTGKENESGDAGFTDVTPDKWYYDIVGASLKYGIVDGFDDNTFRGEDTVSELQLVCLAARALRNEGTAQETDKTYVVSTDNIPDWAKADVEYAVMHEIITEDEAKALSEKEMTRGEAAVILYRLYQVI